MATVTQRQLEDICISLDGLPEVHVEVLSKR